MVFGGNNWKDGVCVLELSYRMWRMEFEGKSGFVIGYGERFKYILCNDIINFKKIGFYIGGKSNNYFIRFFYFIIRPL